MKNEIYDNMLSRYDLTTEQHLRNAIFEVNQQIILAGLYVLPFVRNPKELDIWSNDYFVQLADMVRIE